MHKEERCTYMIRQHAHAISTDQITYLPTYLGHKLGACREERLEGVNVKVVGEDLRWKWAGGKKGR
jgi:hypothetical protein